MPDGERSRAEDARDVDGSHDGPAFERIVSSIRYDFSILLALTFSLFGSISAASGHSLPHRLSWPPIQDESEASKRADEIEKWQETLTTDKNEDAKISAVQSLLRVESPDQNPELIRIFLESEDPDVRQAIIRAYSIAQHDGLVSVLLPWLVDEDAPGVEAANRYYNLMARNLDQWVETLTEVAKNTEEKPAARKGAIVLLGREKKLHPSVEALIALLEEDSQRFGPEALQSLKQITRRDLGTDARSWAAWWEANRNKSRDEIMEEELESLRTSYATMNRERLEFAKRLLAIDRTVVAEFLGHPDFRVQRLALDQINRVAPSATEGDALLMKQWIEALIEKLTIEEPADSGAPRDRAALLRALGSLARFGSEDAKFEESLVASLQSEDLEVKLAAANAARTLASKGARVSQVLDRELDGALQRALDKQDGPALSEMESRLLVGLIRSHGASPSVNLKLLDRALSLGDVQVKLAACEVVGQLETARAAQTLAKVLDTEPGSSESTVRFRAVSALADVAAKLTSEERAPFVQSLVSRLEDESSDVRRQTAKKLRFLSATEGSGISVYEVMKTRFLSGDETESVVLEECVRTLAHLGGFDSLEPLGDELARLDQEPTTNAQGARPKNGLESVLKEEITRVCDRNEDPNESLRRWGHLSSRLLATSPRSAAWALRELLNRFTETSGPSLEPWPNLASQRGIQYELARALFAIDIGEEAWESVKAVSNQDENANPRPVDVLQLQADIAFSLEKWEISSLKYREVISKSNGSAKRRARAELKEALCLARLGRAEEAVSGLLNQDEALRASPTYLCWAALAALSLEKWDTAQAWFRLALERREDLDTDDRTEAIWGLSFALLRQGQGVRSKEVLGSLEADVEMTEDLAKRIHDLKAELQRVDGESLPSEGEGERAP